MEAEARWLEQIAEKAGKGVCNNLDARALKRIARALIAAHERIRELEARTADREALLAERDNWAETARQHHKNEEYYRGLVVRIGEAIGPQSYVSDDGSIQMEVLCAKVPELVEARLAEIDGLQTRMAEGFSAREGQVENGAKMIAELKAGNAKLRREAESQEERIDSLQRRVKQLSDLLDLRLAVLEPTNVPDATE